MRILLAIITLLLSCNLQAGTDRGTEIWIQRLDNSNLPLPERIKAAKHLGQSRDPRAIDALVRALNLPGEEMPGVVVAALRNLNAVEILAPRVVNDALSLQERQAAVKALRYLKDPSGFPVLAKALHSPHDALRADAAWALAVAGARTAEADLIKVLGDPSKNVRYFAAVALGSVKTPTARAALEARKKIEQDFVVLDALTQALR